ncbi:MAG TPA: RagB/SusD family nutrient uptake outer membrane protein, partial [Flavobacterium sp.]|nr:RagB/SusD family nutrient uptake outer membrane protein [Flavobacterium sp.]
YSDVLLMLAEASNQVNNGPNAEAIEAVNQVRRRAFGVDINTPSVAADLTAADIANKASFQLAVEKERTLELCFEGFRRLDLIRWGKYVSTMKSVGAEIRANTQNTGYRVYAAGAENAADKYTLFPIPLREMGVNTKLVQNELWK